MKRLFWFLFVVQLVVAQDVLSQSRGLVAYYPFDGNANDASGNANNGILVGGVTWVENREGQPSKAAHFNGSDAYISVPNSPTLQIGENRMTIALWFDCEATPQIPAPFIGKNNTANEPAQYTLQLNPLTEIHFGITDTSNNMQWGHKEYPFQYDKWYFLAATWDGDTVRIYVDGALMSSSPLKTPMKKDNHPVEIGRDTGGLTDWYQGKLDEVRIYNRALTSAEVNALYSDGLVAYYPLNGNANDASGNGNNGILNGGITWVADYNANAGHAAHFNGTDGYISVPNSPSMQIGTNSMTITLLFNCEATPQIPAPFIGKNNTSDEPAQYTLQLNPLTEIHFGITDTSNNMQWGHKDYAFNYNQWYLLAAAWDGDTVRIYVDKVLVSSSPLKASMKPDNHPVEIGRDTGGLTDWYQGTMDEIRIYNRALSGTEINAIPTSVHSAGTSIPEGYSLLNNYPNPFNPSTTIQYGLPSRSHVSLTVFNSLGQTVTSLMNGEQEAGYHEVHFDGSHLPSGVYFYRMQAGRFTETKKLLLMK
jgi:hypothetical protein